MVVVWATWEEELIWVSASSKFIVVGLLWLLFKLTKTEGRMSSSTFKTLLCSHIAPFTLWDEKTLFIQRAYYTLQDSLAIQVPQRPDQPFVSNKGITEILRPVIICSVAQLFWPGDNEARAWGSIPTQTN